MSSAKLQPFCLGLNVLIGEVVSKQHITKQPSYRIVRWCGGIRDPIFYSKTFPLFEVEAKTWQIVS